MKPTLELQLLAASKLPEKIRISPRHGFVWIEENAVVEDTEWPYIVQELLEPMMTREQKIKYVVRLQSGLNFHAIFADWQQRLTAMDEIGFFENNP